ncbi:MAG: DNA repair protein RadC, partial [Planctomycetes bacterium]|nr:DNA repair protein RadC [Planctomycetota bacterium]
QLILGGARAGEEHAKLARKLLKRFGSMRALASATYHELDSLRDMTEASAARLAASASLYTRILSERRANGPQMRCGMDFYEVYYPKLRDLKKEVFMLILLDQKNRVIRDEKISEGTLTSSLVHPREVFAPAIRESAAAVAFVHNHPSGDSVPSSEDIALTQRLVKTAELVGIRVLDHVIIGEGIYTSFVDDGLIK